jgi:hypothetical protein
MAIATFSHDISFPKRDERILVPGVLQLKV